MKSFRNALLKIIILSAVTVVSAGFSVRVLGAVFPDVTEDVLYYPYIKSLYSQHLIGGDVRTGTFRPKDIITRAELAKAVAYIRLAEEHGIADGWNSKDDFGMAFAVFDLLKPYFGCGHGACASIGGVPFADVPESDPKCMDKLDDSEACEPWFSRYVYYAVSKGLIKGYIGTDGKRYFRPLDPMKRIYAIKIMLADDGNIEPSYDKRFRKLENLADSRDSYSPKCIIGAEEFIKTNGGGNTSEAKRLLEYAVLADRLDIFGNDCRVFTVNGAVTAKQRADFLWKSVKREEIPRYLSLTTSYLPASADPVTDTTVNSASENKGKPASFEYDKSKTVTDNGVTENVNGDTAVKTGTGKAKETVISADTDAVIPDNGITGTTVKAEKGITLTDENGKSCGTIPAGTEFGLLEVRKGSDGKYWQYTDYDGFRLCGFPCSVMMTPECREAMNGVTGSKIVIAMAPGDNTPNPVTMDAVIKRMLPKILQNYLDSGKGTDYWYTVIDGWQTKDDGLWGGVFSQKIYDKAYLLDNLFAQKSGDKYKELIVKVISPAETYDNTDPKAASNKKAMITNYRTDRWYSIIYTDPKKPKEGLKTGYVPVSGVVVKDESVFKITDNNGYYIYKKYNCGYSNISGNNKETDSHDNENIPVRELDKILLHNTAGYTADTNVCANYTLGGKWDSVYKNKFAPIVPEYRPSGTIGQTNGFKPSIIERRSISVEMANIEWVNIATESGKIQVTDGQFHNFNFTKLKGDYNLAKPDNKYHYVKISGDNYNLIRDYFDESEGGLNNDFEQLKIDREVFNRFYKSDIDNKTKLPIFKLQPQYQALINSNSDPNGQLKPLYAVLGKIPFGYKFYTYRSNGTELFKGGLKDIIFAKNTMPYKAYIADDSVSAEKLPFSDDLIQKYKSQKLIREISSYHQKYTDEQYNNLNQFISYQKQKYGIPTKTFSYSLPNGISENYGFYFAQGTKIWKIYNANDSYGKLLSSLVEFKGIISHHNQTYTGKMCPGPGFQIDKLKILNNNI